MCMVSPIGVPLPRSNALAWGVTKSRRGCRWHPPCLSAQSPKHLTEPRFARAWASACRPHVNWTAVLGGRCGLFQHGSVSVHADGSRCSLATHPRRQDAARQGQRAGGIVHGMRPGQAKAQQLHGWREGASIGTAGRLLYKTETVRCRPCRREREEVFMSVCKLTLPCRLCTPIWTRVARSTEESSAGPPGPFCTPWQRTTLVRPPSLSSLRRVTRPRSAQSPHTATNTPRDIDAYGPFTENPSTEDQELMFDFMHKFATVYPCGYCGDTTWQEMMRNPPNVLYTPDHGTLQTRCPPAARNSAPFRLWLLLTV